MGRQIDWKHAAELCEKYKGHCVRAGLLEDWSDTAGDIFDGEKRIFDSWVFAASEWGTPVVMVEMDEGYLCIPCWIEGNDPDMPYWWADGDPE